MSLTLKKSQKAYSQSLSQKKHLLQFGDFGIKVLQSFRISELQVKNLEWACKKIAKSNPSKNPVKIWVRVNLNLNLTKLSLESRMGKGKGNVYTAAQFIKAGTILFEFSRLDYQTKKKLNLYLTNLFPKKIKFITQCRFQGRETQR